MLRIILDGLLWENVERLSRVGEVIHCFNYNWPRKYNVYFKNKMVVYSRDAVAADNEDVTFTTNFDYNVFTHIYIERNLTLHQDLLLGLVSGKFFTNSQLLQEDEARVPFPTFEYSDSAIINNAIRKSANNVILKRPKLFDGISFFIHSCCNYKYVRLHFPFLHELIRMGGGKVLRVYPTASTEPRFDETLYKPYHTPLNQLNTFCRTYVLFADGHLPDQATLMPDLMFQPTSWFIESILEFTILPIRPLI